MTYRLRQTVTAVMGGLLVALWVAYLVRTAQVPTEY